jgi:hypothetical protein
MVGIERPSVEANIRAEAVKLGHSFDAVVAVGAECLKLTREKQIHVAIVRDDVIDVLAGGDDAALFAEAAERFDLTLMPAQIFPALSVVKVLMLRRV